MKTTLTGLALAPAATAASADANWGPEDQIGAANRIAPASEMITTGKTYPLGILIDETNPAFPPHKLTITLL